ncbi:MAG: adenosylmethionine--8-amino-7-oxononanoate transaminase [Candidatus Melainabacteria bacterium RIFOXYA12_FULL_32_12]|nr:MAG: adenosylmethionine--8-amino-7-oxononanoate transaminase [Candidatus Melainabacteria bacterium RIFOXYA12_FULL_32_12]
MTSYQELIEKDLKYVWHPFTQMKDYENDEPIIIDRGEGVYIWDLKGNKYIDAISSWWVNTLGHSNKRLNNAIKAQLDKIEHVLLAGFSHKPAIELAEKLIQMTPKELTRVFYSDNGSTAVEVALKMAYQYWVQVGEPQRNKFIALKNSYHGDTIGAVSIGGVDLYHKIYKPLLFDIHQADSPYCYRCPAGKNKSCCNCECLESMENILKEYSNEVIGIIVEPLVQAAGGMIIYPTEYLTKVKELCEKYNVLLIDDEVAMGFGRTGKMFAFEHASIVPDIVCLAKGLTAGYMPLAVTITTEKIYQAFYDDYDKLKTFYHGHSFTGNPLAASVALENLKILEEEKIIESIQPKISRLKAELEKFKELDCVGDIRHIGMIGAIEIVKSKDTKELYPFKDRMGVKIYKEGLKRGAILRPLGNIVYFMPPYVITEEEITKLTDIAYDSIKAALY